MVIMVYDKIQSRSFNFSTTVMSVLNTSSQFNQSNLIVYVLNDEIFQQA